MTTKKAKQKLMKHHICSAARIIACVSFLVLTIIGVSSLVRAMSLETIANEDGVPTAWEAASLGSPDTITVPATFWDQRQDDCNDQNRQFEWVICNFWTAGAIQGIVKDTLGADGLPVPAFTNSTDAWNAHRDVFTANVTGHDPVQPSDNFYRWFHNTAKSQSYQREVTFTRTGPNTYSYGREGVFPMDDVDFSDGDSAWEKSGHNYHFTSHMSIPIKVIADGQERFEFSGDDDVWVFLNGKLVLDIGGLHEKLNGWFTINPDGTVSTYVQNVNNTSVRDRLGKPSNDFNSYVDPLNRLNRETFQDKYETIDIGLEPGDVVNLDFFYAERSTTESNTKVTISDMNWPISADSELKATIAAQLPEKDSNLIQYDASIKNRDPNYPLKLERLAAYIEEDSKHPDQSQTSQTGFLPLDIKTLSYTTTPEDESSWQNIDISAPANSTAGFNLAQPLTMAPAGTAGDTLYFRYYSETATTSGTTKGTVSFYTSMEGNAGVTYDYDSVSYDTPIVEVDHTLTIKYLYEDDTPAADDHVETLKNGESFAVNSPEIDGFIPDIKVVSGVIQNDDPTYIVYYRPKPVEPPIEPDEPDEPTLYNLTIHYVYEDGTKAADDHHETLAPGTEFNVPSPEIDQYAPDYEIVKGTMDENDLEYIVRYKTKPTPITPTEPDQPEEPDTPSKPTTPVTPPEPEQPTEPTPPVEPEQPAEPTTPEPPTPPVQNIAPYIPASNMIDGDLLYLAPLGEIAFVPNTGIISEAASALFEAGFAEIILSQGFVMLMLLIFASSFAIYFSLRRYLDFKPATQAISTTRRNASRNTNRTTNHKSSRKAQSTTTQKTQKARKSTKSQSLRSQKTTSSRKSR